MDLKNLQKTWNDFGEKDPLWAILSDPHKKGNKWKIDEFFETGKREIDTIFTALEKKGIHFPRKKALDFGCGVGRVTQALALYFDDVLGVDIAPSMIRLAQQLNRHRTCTFLLNTTDDLRQFPDSTFDFIYSNITLQHIAPRYTKKYIKEFIRVLIPGGLLLFQLPSEPANYKTRFKRGLLYIVPTNVRQAYVQLVTGLKVREMHSMKKEAVIQFIKENNGTLIEVVPTQDAGPDWVSFQYFVTKN